MGIDRNTAALLAKIRSDGVAFGRVLTLGRQTLYLDPPEVVRLGARFGMPRVEHGAYAEPFFMALGATEVVAMDASGFESAAMVHDLNVPVDDSWHEQFDLIFDGGTLEHIFRFPVALASVMQMLRHGGRFVTTTPMNSWCGHGFYQFSPELYWRSMTRENGFSIVEMYAAGGTGCYAVAEPARVRERVTLCCQEPINLMVHAVRDAVVALLTTAPQQSDYVTAWTGGPTAAPIRARWKTVPLIRDALALRRHYRYLRYNSLRNRKFYTPVDLRL